MKNYFSILFCLFSFAAFSQQPTPSICIDFSDNSSGVYAADLRDTLFSTSNIPVVNENFFNGTINLNDVEVTDRPLPDFTKSDGNYLRTKNSTVKFKFSDHPAFQTGFYDGTAMAVSVDYHYSGGWFNILWNGQHNSFDGSLNSIAESVESNYYAEAFETTTPTGKTGTLFWYGTQTDFGIGGENLVIDNVCFYAYEDRCDIKEVTGKVINCDSTSYEVEVSFDSENVGLMGMQIYYDRELAGEFPYGQSSYVIGPFDFDGTNPHFVSVNDRQLVREFGCWQGYNITVDKDDCAASSNCGMGDLELEFVEMDGDSVIGRLNDYFGNNTGDSFTLYVSNGSDSAISLGNFGYHEIPLEFSFPCDLSNENGLAFWTCDVSDSNCCSMTGWINFDQTGCQSSSSAKDLFSEDLIKISPNPTSAQIQVSLPENFKAESFKLFDLTGKQLNLIQNSDLEFDLSEQVDGIYFLKIESTDKFVFKKIIKN